MTTSKLNEFIEALIKDTLENRLEWQYVDQLADDECFPSGFFPYELSGTEFSEIDYHRTYACQTNVGFVFLVYTMVTSGHEYCESWEGFELILHPSPYNPGHFFSLLQQSEKLYRLENAVRNNASNSVRCLLRDEDYYLDLYLRARQ